MKRGEIIIVDYPFTDQQGKKRRPALVIQSDAIKSSDTLIAGISSSAQPAATRVLIDPSAEPASHLTMACVVRCENISTIQNTMVLGSIGQLSKQTMNKGDECLKKALSL